MVFVIHKDNPQQRLIKKSVEIIDSGGLIIYPTDTVYAFGCDLRSRSAIEKIYRLKNLPPAKPLSILVPDISSMTDYVRGVNDRAFKIMKKALPGPYTFVFKANKQIPRYMLSRQKTVGIRIPDHKIARELVRQMGRPLISTSVQPAEGEYLIDPENLEKWLRNDVDLIIDAGVQTPEPSTIVDCTEDEPRIIRYGKGDVFFK